MHMTAHTHGEGTDTYFVDQLCTVGIAAAYAGVMTAMFWTTATSQGERTLLSIIATWIRYTVLAGSFVLLFLAIARAVALWRASGTHALAHDHEHGQCCDHDHDHTHHAHAHDHGHDHGWSPWRYAVMILPLLLFFLPFDYNRMIGDFERELIRDKGGLAGTSLGAGPGETMTILSTLAFDPYGLDPAGALVFALGTSVDTWEQEADAGNAVATDLRQLDDASQTPDGRAHWQQVKKVEVEGLFNPASPDGKRFLLVRITIACCLNDGQPLVAIGASKKPVPIAANDWVTIQGKVDFAKGGDGQWKPVIRATSVKKTPMPRDAYLK